MVSIKTAVYFSKYGLYTKPVFRSRSVSCMRMTDLSFERLEIRSAKTLIKEIILTLLRESYSEQSVI